jgi:hypothetical protein
VLSRFHRGKLTSIASYHRFGTTPINYIDDFSFSFLVGIVISSILLSVVDSSVNTVLVCFAEAPEEFTENHPDLSSNMRDAWRKVYPVECGF